MIALILLILTVGFVVLMLLAAGLMLCAGRTLPDRAPADDLAVARAAGVVATRPELSDEDVAEAFAEIAARLEADR